MEGYQTTEEIKEEVLDCGFVEVDSQDVHQLCTACLCATRTTHTLSDGALKQYYMHILTEMQPEGGVVLQSPRVCWECVSHLKRSVRFREQVQDSYRLLQPMLSMCDKEDLDEFLQTSVRRPGRLKTCFAHSINISPQDDDTQVMTVTKHDDDDEAALGSLENGIERHSSTFTEDDASIVEAEDPSEAFCDEKYDVCVSDSEGVVKSPPMCNYNIHYKKNDRSNMKEQLDETNAHLRKEVLNDTEIMNTPIFTHVSTMRRDLNTTFLCDYCFKTYYSKAALERHIATFNIYPHNNKTVPSPCEDCAVVLCSDDQCSDCPNKLHLLQHRKKQSKTAEKHFLNDMCDQSFSIEANFTREKKVYSDEKSSSNLNQHRRKHAGAKSFQCEVCHRILTLKSLLIRHMRIHTGEKPFQYKLCRKSFAKKSDLIGHMRIHTGEKPYQCDMCHKSFKGLSNFYRHTRTHTGEKPFQCEVCRKPFALKSHLINHMRTHTGEKPFQCEVCRKPFALKSHLFRHMRTHTGEKSFQCEVCLKSFAEKSHLIRHMRTHTGEKPFQCEVCRKSFAEKSHLIRHMRTHTGEKPFQCEVCRKSFANKGDLITHKRIHAGEKPFQCEVCRKSFANKGNLITHKRIHAGEKPFQCEVCHKSFARKSHLLYHLRTHTGEKPYSCAECLKSYISKRSLFNHIRTHTTQARRLTSH